ncbi:MAG: TetR/AcrR family transcriptional regulator [Mucinivorans sp.]
MERITTKIVEASTELFLREGIKCVTMDDVAQNLGMSKRTIYEHFNNKRSLLMACIDHNYERQVEREEQVVAKAKNIVEELYCMLQPVSQDHLAEHKFSVELKRYFPDIFRELYATRYDHISGRIRARLQRGIDQGIVQSDTNLDISVYVIFGTMRTFIARYDNINKQSFSSEELFRYIFISFFRGIATTKGVLMIDEMISNVNKTSKI